MTLTRQQQYCLNVCFSLCVLASTTLLYVQAESSLDDVVPSSPPPSSPRPAQDLLDISTDAEDIDTPSLHEYLVRFFSSPNPNNHDFLELPKGSLPSRSLCDAHADHGSKTVAPTPAAVVLLSPDLQESEDQDAGVTVERGVLDSEPLRTGSPPTLPPSSARPRSPLSLPLGLNNADELIMAIFFRLWAALHPQDTAYYVDLSQRASTPALSPITGLYDMLNINDQSNPNLASNQGSPAVDLSGTALQNLLLELLTKTTANSAASWPTET